MLFDSCLRRTLGCMHLLFDFWIIHRKNPAHIFVYCKNIFSLWSKQYRRHACFIRRAQHIYTQTQNHNITFPELTNRSDVYRASTHGRKIEKIMEVVAWVPSRFGILFFLYRENFFFVDLCKIAFPKTKFNVLFKFDLLAVMVVHPLHCVDYRYTLA